MANYKSYKDLPDKMAHFLVPTKAIGMMCGVDYASQDNSGEISLIYADGSIEKATVKGMDLCSLPEDFSFFDLVSAVQKERVT